MFDVSFGELILIGVIALVVIGPERLPKVARTVGHLLGRAQRYVNDVKTDIQREIDLSEVNSIKSQIEDAAKNVKASMHEAADDLRKPIDDAQKAFQDASEAVNHLASGGTGDTAGASGPEPEPEFRLEPQTGPTPTVETPAPALVPDPDSPLSGPPAAAETPDEAAEASLPLPGFAEPDAEPAPAKSSTQAPT